MIYFVYVLTLVAIVFIYEKRISEERNKNRDQLQSLLKSAEEERKELYDRIMSNNIHDFKAATTDEPKKNNRPRNFLKAQIDKAYKEG